MPATLSRFGVLATAPLAALLVLSACAGVDNASSSPANDGLVAEIAELASCGPLEARAESYLGAVPDVTGSGRNCAFFLPEQVAIDGASFWSDVHVETIPIDPASLDGVPVGELEVVATIVEAEGLTPRTAPSGWSFAGEAPGKLDLLLVARNGMALHCDASLKPGGASTGATPPAIDLEALLAFCDDVRDLAVEKP